MYFYPKEKELPHGNSYKWNRSGLSLSLQLLTTTICRRKRRTIL